MSPVRQRFVAIACWLAFASPGVAVVAATPQLQTSDGLGLDTGAFVVDGATLGLLAVGIDGSQPLTALGFGLVLDGPRADSLAPVVRDDVSVVRTSWLEGSDRITFLDSVANHGTRPRRILLRWTSHLPGERARPDAEGWTSTGGWTQRTGVAGRLVNGWPAGKPRYPGHDPAYIGWEVHFTLRPGERRAVLATIARGGALRDAPIAGLLSASQWRSVLGHTRGGGGTPLLAGRAATLATWRRWLASADAEAVAADSVAHAAWLRTRHPGLAPLSQINPRVLQDARSARGHGGPLAGLPFVVKDVIDVAGMPTLSLPGPAPAPSRRDAVLVERLRDAGAVLLGKATFDEDFGDYGMHRATGRLSGLLHPDLTVAGSSGGSAIAVAAGIVPLALGSDTCGSLATPASHAGIAAFRPTAGALPYIGARPLDPDFDTLGPLVAHAMDLPATLEALGLVSDSPRALADVRLGVLDPAPPDWPTAQAEVVRHFERAVARLRSAGVTIVPVSLRNWQNARVRLRASPDAARAAAALSAWLALRGDGQSIAGLASSSHLLPEERAALAELAQAQIDGTARAARDAALAFLQSAVTDEIESVDVAALLLPATLAWPGLLDVTRFAGGEPSTCTLSSLARLPQATLPIAARGGEPPLGAALVGMPGSDVALARLAATLQPLLAPAANGGGRDMRP